MIQEFEGYKYNIFNNEKGWTYVIYDKYIDESDNSKLINSECFHETEQRANLAAIGNILLITKGKIKCL
jgi:hypothetical protein